MAKWGCKLPENLQWVKGSPYIWFDFSIKGTRFRDSTKTVSVSDAKDILAAVRKKTVLGQHYKTLGVITLTEAFAKYWAQHGTFLKAKADEREHLKHIIGYFGGSKELQAIGTDELSSYIAHCRTEKRQRHFTRDGERHDIGEPYCVSPATINRRLAAFRNMHNRARLSWGVQVQNIDFKKLKLKEPKAPDNPYSPDEAQKLLDIAPEHMHRFIYISLYAGLRSRSNVLQLEGKHLDKSKRIITITGKGDKANIVSIPDELHQYFIREGIYEAGRIITYKGKPVKTVYTAWRNLHKLAKVPYRRPHDLRHTFGTWLYQETGDIKLVQEALHHASIATTMRYAHSDKDKQRAAINSALPKFTTIARTK